MCRARPGPRCSYDAGKRHLKAVNNHNWLTQKVEWYVDQGRTPPKRLRVRYNLGVRRLEAAQRVWWSTPRGQEELKENIEQITETLEAQYPHGAPDVLESDAFSEYSVLIAEQERFTLAKEEGRTHRINSLADMKLSSADERRSLRQQTTARGGRISANAHPVSAEVAAGIAEGLEVESLRLRAWNEHDVARASSWVEQGADPGLVDNNRLRPVRTVRDEEGSLIPVGDKVEGISPRSRLIRLNTPDGQVVEGRHDFHLTKNSRNEYVVTVRSMVGSSWEDASPIDVTRQQVGHIISDSSRHMSQHKQFVGKSTSLEEAKEIFNNAQSEFDAAKVTAIIGRDRVVHSARRSNDTLQRRGINVWHRYAPDTSAQGIDAAI